MRKILFKISIVILFFTTTVSYSQANISSEVGIMFGVTSFQTDFGLRHDFSSENAQTMGFGIIHYLKFFGNQYNWRSGSTFFSEHFMLKTELSYINNKNIKHEKEAFSEGSIEREKWDAMRGDIVMWNFGNQMEFYFFNIEDYSSLFRNKRVVNPYISVGVQVSFYDPEVTSKYSGPYQLIDHEDDKFIVYVRDDNNQYDKWITEEASKIEDKNGNYHDQTIFNDSGVAFGLSAGLGVRFSLENFDFVLDSRWQYFFSDEIDGLNAKKDPGNLNNDTMIFVNLGIVYTFNRY